ncbi:MAG: hypothetical protein QM731_08725 [Chitinophagaceae bacterium]
MRTFLIVLIAFAGLTCMVCGLLMTAYPTGELLGLSTDLLQGTSLKNFLVPGFILTLVGVVNTSALLAHLQKSRNRYNWSIASGSLLCIWIVTQMVMIQVANLLQLLYFLCGLLIVLMSYQFRGKWAA